jgi:hypothetical protein
MNNFYADPIMRKYILGEDSKKKEYDDTDIKDEPFILPEGTDENNKEQE